MEKETANKEAGGVERDYSVYRSDRFAQLRGQTNQDLLKAQKEYFESKGKAAKGCERGKEKTEKETKEKRGSERVGGVGHDLKIVEHDMRDTKEEKGRGLDNKGGVIEDTKRTMKTKKTNPGFPSVHRLTQEEIETHVRMRSTSGPRQKKKSLFALRMEAEARKRQAQNTTQSKPKRETQTQTQARSQSKSGSQKESEKEKEKGKEEGPLFSQVWKMNANFERDDLELSEAQIEDIQNQNDEVLMCLSEEEILAERNRLLRTLDPRVIAMFTKGRTEGGTEIENQTQKQRGQQSKKAKTRKKKTTTTKTAKTDPKPTTERTERVESKSKRKPMPNLAKSQRTKVESQSDSNKDKQREMEMKAKTKPKTAKEERNKGEKKKDLISALNSLRFGFAGRILNPHLHAETKPTKQRKQRQSGTHIPEHAGLKSESESETGYTMREVINLMRSTQANQRMLGLKILLNVCYSLKTNAYSNLRLCELVWNTQVIDHGALSVLLLVLSREKNLTCTLVALYVLHSLLCDQIFRGQGAIYNEMEAGSLEAQRGKAESDNTEDTEKGEKERGVKLKSQSQSKSMSRVRLKPLNVNEMDAWTDQQIQFLLHSGELRLCEVVPNQSSSLSSNQFLASLLTSSASASRVVPEISENVWREDLILALVFAMDSASQTQSASTSLIPCLRRVFCEYVDAWKGNVRTESESGSETQESQESKDLRVNIGYIVGRILDLLFVLVGYHPAIVSRILREDELMTALCDLIAIPAAASVSQGHVSREEVNYQCQVMDILSRMCQATKKSAQYMDTHQLWDDVTKFVVLGLDTALQFHASIRTSQSETQSQRQMQRHKAKGKSESESVVSIEYFKAQARLSLSALRLWKIGIKLGYHAQAFVSLYSHCSTLVFQHFPIPISTSTSCSTPPLPFHDLYKLQVRACLEIHATLLSVLTPQNDKSLSSPSGRAQSVTWKHLTEGVESCLKIVSSVVKGEMATPAPILEDCDRLVLGGVFHVVQAYFSSLYHQSDASLGESHSVALKRARRQTQRWVKNHIASWSLESNHLFPPLLTHWKQDRHVPYSTFYEDLQETDLINDWTLLNGLPLTLRNLTFFGDHLKALGCASFSLFDARASQGPTDSSHASVNAQTSHNTSSTPSTHSLFPSNSYHIKCDLLIQILSSVHSMITLNFSEIKSLLLKSRLLHAYHSGLLNILFQVCDKYFVFRLNHELRNHLIQHHFRLEFHLSTLILQILHRADPKLEHFSAQSRALSSRVAVEVHASACVLYEIMPVGCQYQAYLLLLRWVLSKHILQSLTRTACMTHFLAPPSLLLISDL